MQNLHVVVKICNIPKIVVVPLENIYKLNLAKSLNNRINRNQIHLLFWSNDQTRVPNFRLPISNRFDPSTDSCFNVKLLKVFESRALALQYKNSRRKIEPAVYNLKRLSERPFPVTQANRNTQKNRLSTNGAIKPKHNQQRPIHTVADRPRATITVVDARTSSESHVVTEDAQNSENDIDMDTNPTVENNVASDGSTKDVICLSDPVNAKRHRPIKTFDVISGRHTFMLTPKGDRVYSINGHRFKINKDIVDRLLYYNKSPNSSNNTSIDKTFIDFLLLSVFSVSHLKQNEINNDLLKIIKDFYKNRVGRDKARFENFENFVKNKCDELRQNQNAE